MTNIARHWRLATRRPGTGSSGEHRLSREASQRRIVAEHSRGNIRLQRGEYVTQGELAKQYERLKGHDFGDGG